MSYINKKIILPINLNIIYKNIKEDIEKAIDLGIATKIYNLHLNTDKKLRDVFNSKIKSQRNKYLKYSANEYLNFDGKTLFESIEDLKSVFVEIGWDKKDAEIILVDSPNKKIDKFMIDNLNILIKTHFSELNNFLIQMGFLFPSIRKNIVIDLKDYNKYVNNICQNYGIKNAKELVLKGHNISTFNMKFKDRTNKLTNHLFIDIANRYGVDINLSYLKNENNNIICKIENIQNKEDIEKDGVFIDMLKWHNTNYIKKDTYSISLIVKNNPELSHLISGKEEFDILTEKEEINKSLNDVLNKFKIKKNNP